jgi:site-specific DNA recombinase
MRSANSNGTQPVTKAWLYCRFSPRKNGDTCESNDIQLSYCQDYCAERGYRIVGQFEDRNASGADENRPGLWAAVEALKRGGVLVAHKYDRIARSVFLDEYLRREVAKKGARIEVVEGGREGDSPQDVLVRQILSAVAEAERKIIAARTVSALKYYRANGYAINSTPPYGEMFGEPSEVTLPSGAVVLKKTWVKNPEEQAVIERIRSMRDSGMSFAAIGRQLDAEGVPARGTRWSHPMVGRICRREG